MSAFDEALREATQRPADKGLALPFEVYRDPEHFEREMAAIFRADWVVVCPSASLPDAGDALALDIGNEPVVVLRGRDGQLRALSNVCRHRGTPILDEGLHHGQRLICPYHAWAYADDGKFRGAPHTDKGEVDEEDHALPLFALEEWAGIVFVNIEGQAPPLRDRLGPVEEALRGFDLAQYDVPIGGWEPETWTANWKLAFENGIESYHLFKVHKETLETITPTRDSFYVAGGPLASVSAGALTQNARLSSAQTFEDENYVLISLPPSFVAIVTRTSIGWIAVHPVAATKTRVVGNALVPNAYAPPAGERDTTDEFTAAFLAEDRFICERGQRGMKSHASKGGQLVQMERIVGDFHQYLGQRLYPNAAPPKQDSNAGSAQTRRPNMSRAADRRPSAVPAKESGPVPPRPFPTRALLALIGLWAAVALSWSWPWGLLFLAATLQSIRTGVIDLIEPIPRETHPSMFWSVAGTWIVLSLALVGWDVAQWILP